MKAEKKFCRNDKGMHRNIMAVLRTGAMDAVAPINFEKGLIAIVDFEDLLYEQD